jgi:hypothetical protein
MADEQDEGAAVAEEIRRVREAARAATEARSTTLPAARAAAPTSQTERPAVPASNAAPLRPRVDDVHRLTRISPASPGGWRGMVFRLMRRALGASVENEQAFRGAQAQMNDAVLDYVDARADATHRHYDAVLGQYGQHIADANERHRLLQSELVAHVHDLVDRIDLVLAESERGRLSLEAELQDLRARLVQLEERAGGSRPR